MKMDRTLELDRNLEFGRILEISSYLWFFAKSVWILKDDLDTEFEDCELVQPFAGYEEEMLDYFNDSSSDGGGDDTETEGC